MPMNISAAGEIAGFIGACLVDCETGLMLASEGGGDLDLEAVAVFGAEILKAQRQAIDMQGMDDHVEEILISLHRQIHMIRPVERAKTLFLYAVFEGKAANLGMVRLQLKKIESTIST